jgi:calcineurin-like phosphoesterase family protein
MARFWTADNHFGHKNIIRFAERPFTHVEQMNEVMVARAWSIMNADDELWVLGDLAMGDLADSLSIAARLPGRKVLVIGNHDRPMNEKTGPRRAAAIPQYEAAGFEVVTDTWIRENIGGHDVLVSHFPYQGDSHGPDRYAAVRAVDEGLPIIHGHVHQEFLARHRQYNVGVDVHDFYPVPEQTVIDWLDTLPGH